MSLQGEAPRDDPGEDRALSPLAENPAGAAPIEAAPRPDGTDLIVKALADRDARVRLNAMIALRSRLTPELLPVIEPLLSDRDDTIRAYAVDYYADLT